MRVWCEGIDLVLMPNLQSKSLFGCQSLPLAYDTRHMESANFFVVFASVSTHEATYTEFFFLFQWRHQQKVTWCLLNLELLISLCSGFCDARIISFLKSLLSLSCFHTLNWSLILTNTSHSMHVLWFLKFIKIACSGNLLVFRNPLLIMCVKKNDLAVHFLRYNLCSPTIDQLSDSLKQMHCSRKEFTKSIKI